MEEERYATRMENGPTSDDWVALTDGPLSVDEAASWSIIPSCGAVVTFAGTVRDQSDDRDGVTALSYEAYAEQVEPRLSAIAGVCRERWPMVGRLVLWHRIGELGLGDISVVCAASTPHRPEAFEAARFLIDAVKATVPIWKRETWSGGSDWSRADHEIEDLEFAPDNERLVLAEGNGYQSELEPDLERRTPGSIR